MGEVVTESPGDDTLLWIQQALLASAGRGTPREGMVYSGILFVIVWSWTMIGLVFTIFLDVIFALLFLYNFGRAVYGAISERRAA